MRKEIDVHVSWGDRFGKPPKTPEERARDEALAQELLQHIRQMRNVKIIQDFDIYESPDGYSLKIVNNEEAFRFLMEALQPAPHLVNKFGLLGVMVWKTYTHQELESAPLLLWYVIDHAIEDDYYDGHDRMLDGYRGGEQASHRLCPACRTKLAQVRDLLVQTRKMGKRDLSEAYGSKVILSARLAQMLQEAGFTGFTLRPVWHYRKPYEGEPPLFQLVVTNVLSPMASPPTEFEDIEHCDVCGRTSQSIKCTQWWGRVKYLEETPIYYPRQALEEAQDFNHTAEYFAPLPVAHPYVIISQRVYRWLREQKVKGWYVEPVYLVE